MMSIGMWNKQGNKEGWAIVYEDLEKRVKALEEKLDKWVGCNGCNRIVMKLRTICVYPKEMEERYGGFYCEDCMDTAAPKQAVRYRLDTLAETDPEKVLECTKKVKESKNG